MVFKLQTNDIKTSRVLLESDWRGTNVQVKTNRKDGILPETYKLGADSEVQTITFRRASAPVGCTCKHDFYFFC